MPGPPLVSISGQVKISKAPMNAVAEAMNVAGDSSGSVIRRNLENALAPSIEAASYRSAGMLCRPTRKMMKVNPNLMSPSAVQFAFEQTHFIRRAEHAIFRFRRAAAF